MPTLTIRGLPAPTYERLKVQPKRQAPPQLASKIEGLLRALGGEVTEGRGSRVRFRLGNRVATFHGPHPGRVTGKATVEDVRRFLENAGIKP
jgi:hypothetical protein